MKTSKPDPLAPRPELDFRKGARGKHLERLRTGSNVVAVDADLLATFADSAAVNAALRSVMRTREVAAAKRKQPRADVFPRARLKGQSS